MGPKGGAQTALGRPAPAVAPLLMLAPRPLQPPPPPPLARSNPLPAGAVLIDEASMLSLPLAAALVDALRSKCQLVLVGDVDQLPPVGAYHRRPACGVRI